MRSFALILVGLVLAVSAAAEDISFSVEPANHVTIRPSAELPAGATIELELEGLPARSVFSINRCGELCNTAKEVFAIASAEDTTTQRATFTAEETGQYYLWLKRFTASGEMGPVRISSVISREGTFKASFEGGGTVSGLLSLPVDGPAPPIAVKGEDRVEIISVEPLSAPRGVETEFVVELEVELASAANGVVMLGFNTVKPTAFRMSETRNVAAGPHRIKVHLRAVTVDWGEKGQFTLFANIGPKPNGSRWTPAASAKQEISILP